MSFIFDTLTYVKYFYRVVQNNRLSYSYSLIFPAAVIFLNLIGTDQRNVIATLIPTIAYMIFTSAIKVILEVALLREQGYLKQYHSLVTSNLVFVFSKLIVEMMLLIATIFIILTIICFIYSDLLWALFSFFIITLLVIFISLLPLLGLCSILLHFNLNTKTITTLSNLLMFLSIFLIYFSINNFPLLNLINPVYIVMNLFYLFLYGMEVNFLVLVTVSLITYLLIGTVSLRSMTILPVEG